MDFFDMSNPWADTVPDTVQQDASAGFQLEGDLQEAARMEPFKAQVAGSEAMPWWQSLVMYGATRAIDNKVGPPAGIAGNTNPGYFGGANGRTYLQRPGAAGAPASTAQAGVANLLGNPMVLMGAGLLLFLALRK